MGQFVVGDIVVITFPFSNLKGQKVRPALVLAQAEFDNLILCQITSKPYSSQLAIRVEKAHFVQGLLPIVSYIRPDKLFTADPSIINKKVGQLNQVMTDKVLTQVKNLFSRD